MVALTRVLFAALALGIFSTLLGGLARLGHISSSYPPSLVAHHGALMCGALLPGVVSLERAIAIGAPWAWCGPASAVVALLGVAWQGKLAFPALALTGLFLSGQHLYLWRRSPGLDGPIAVSASLILVATDIAWGQGLDPGYCALGWASFLILIIGAERLELSFLRGLKSGALPALLAGLIIALAMGQPRGIGLAWVGISLWLARFDLARRNARRQGLAAYSARAILLGYAWLAASGAQLAVFGLPFTAGLAFDRILHGVFVGFVLSMIMAHGPIIFPAIWKSPMAFTPWFYLPLGLLHLSLGLRVAGMLSAGATLNLASLMLFGLTLALHRRAGHNPWLPPPPPKGDPACYPPSQPWSGRRGKDVSGPRR